MNHGGNVWISGDPSEWLDFSANLRPEGPPSWVLEAYHAAAETLRFYPDPEMKRVRKGLASFLGVPEEYVLPTAGGTEAIDLSLAVCSGTVFIHSPSFGEYAARAAARGRKVAEWNGRCGSGDSLVLSNPCNPTGSAKSREELLSLHDRIQADGGQLIIDEAFIEFCPEYSLTDHAGPGLMILGSLSKILGVPGIRLGYICASPEIVGWLQRQMLPWSPDAAATEIAARLPEHTDLVRQDAVLNRQRRIAFSAMLQNLGAEVYPSESNFLLADFHRDMSSAVDALARRKILVRTCADFGLPGSFRRLAVKTEAENKYLTEILEEILHAR